MSIPIVVLLLVSGLVALVAGAVRISVVDSAGVAARAVARGEKVPALGEGVEVVSIEYDGDLVRVSVRRTVGGLPIQQTAVAMVEPQAGSGW